MPKPRLFIGSSVEGLPVAYSAQEGLEHDMEVTVWSQSVFDPSRFAMDELQSEMDQSDFALFAFEPDDVTRIRGEEFRTARDNVILELGLFIGRLGRERTFILLPRESEPIHLPTDLLGITPLTYEPNRTDENLVAALGPACQRIRKVMSRLGEFQPSTLSSTLNGGELIDDPDDIIAHIQSWMGKRRSGENTGVIKFADVDRELGLVSGSAEKYISEAAERWSYVPERTGKTSIIFRKAR